MLESKLRNLAAANACGLVRNHPFLDGSKRIGFTVAVLFLEPKGKRFTAPEAEARLMSLALAARERDKPGPADSLRKSSQRAGKEA